MADERRTFPQGHVACPEMGSTTTFLDGMHASGATIIAPVFVRRQWLSTG
jgi:hypothetical protein